jgi:hypothetical protein
VRNTYQPTPGEFLVGDKLERLGYDVYLPSKDRGVDLLAEKAGRFVRVQVKESRTYLENGEPTVSWTQLRPDALTSSKCDFFVFVVYSPTEEGHRLKFEPFYIVISPRVLERRLSEARPGKSDRAVYWQRRGKELYEARSKPPLDFSEFLEGWHFLASGGLRTSPNVSPESVGAVTPSMLGSV